MLQCALGRLGAHPASTPEVVRLRFHPPCTREPELVSELLEDGYRTVSGLDELLGRDPRIGEEAKEAALHEGVSGQTTITGGRGGLHCFRERSVRPGQVRSEPLDDSHVRHELDA